MRFFWLLRHLLLCRILRGWKTLRDCPVPYRRGFVGEEKFWQCSPVGNVSQDESVLESGVQMTRLISGIARLRLSSSEATSHRRSTFNTWRVRQR